MYWNVFNVFIGFESDKNDHDKSKDQYTKIVHEKRKNSIHCT